MWRRRAAAIGLVVWAGMPLANDAPPLPSPEGQSFTGTVRATGWRGLIGREGTLAFEGGRLSWRVGDEPQEFAPAPYALSPGREGSAIFRARMPGARGDHVEWHGRFDGSTLHDVTATWTRVPGDFVHDLLLPPVVTLRFTPR